MPALITVEEMKQMASTFDEVSYKPLNNEELSRIVEFYRIVRVARVETAISFNKYANISWRK